MEKEITINQHQTYDNAFLSVCAWHKRLLIPLANEIFGKNIPEDAIIEHEPNEQFAQGKDNNGKEKLIKRITDALIRVNNETYHFECESKKDGEILIRIAEYDMIENEAHKVYDSLIKEYEKNNLNITEYENLLLLCKDVVSELCRNTDIQERLVDIMGNEVLLTAEERGIIKGVEQGAFSMALDNIKNAMNSLNKPFDEVCQILNIQDKEKYREFIK